jgi:hypothetical protein
MKRGARQGGVCRVTAIMVASRRTLAKRSLQSKIETPKSKIR